MSTAFAGIVGALLTRLAQAPAVSANLYRCRLRALPESVTGAVVVRLQQADADNNVLSGNPIDFTTRVEVECYARSHTTTADLAVDDLLQAVYTRIMADPTLGGSVMYLDLSALRFDFDAEAEQFAVATLSLDVRHRTSGLTLT